MKKKARILLYDIETTPMEAFVWRKWVNGPVIKIKKDWELLSFAWRWLGEKTINCISRRRFDELGLINRLHALMDEADLTVSHNGWQFDDKKVRAKYLQYKLRPHSPVDSVDTKYIASKFFGLSDNSLEGIATRLGHGKKVKHRGFDLWEDCMAGKVSALKELETYNKGDIKLLDPVYRDLRTWATNHPNVSLIVGSKTGCPSCGSQEVKKDGVRARGLSFRQQWMCKPCGRYYLTSMKAG